VIVAFPGAIARTLPVIESTAATSGVLDVQRSRPAGGVCASPRWSRTAGATASVSSTTRAVRGGVASGKLSVAEGSSVTTGSSATTSPAAPVPATRARSVATPSPPARSVTAAPEGSLTAITVGASLVNVTVRPRSVCPSASSTCTVSRRVWSTVSVSAATAKARRAAATVGPEGPSPQPARTTASRARARARARAGPPARGRRGTEAELKVGIERRGSWATSATMARAPRCDAERAGAMGPGGRGTRRGSEPLAQSLWLRAPGSG
jgi:hypothetical protein